MEHKVPYSLGFSLGAVEGGRWHWGLGDPGIGAVFVTALYILVALTCLITARRNPALQPGSAPEFDRRNQNIFWLGLACGMLFLGINKQADFQSLLTLFGRDLLRSGGLYDARRLIQVVFIVVVAAGTASGVSFCLRLAYRWSWTGRMAVIGLGMQTAFIVIRAASFHHVDGFWKLQFADVKLNLLLESTGLLILLIAACCSWITRTT